MNNDLKVGLLDRRVWPSERIVDEHDLNEESTSYEMLSMLNGGGVVSEGSRSVGKEEVVGKGVVGKSNKEDEKTCNNNEIGGFLGNEVGDKEGFRGLWSRLWKVDSIENNSVKIQHFDSEDEDNDNNNNEEEEEEEKEKEKDIHRKRSKEEEGGSVHTIDNSGVFDIHNHNNHYNNHYHNIHTTNTHTHIHTPTHTYLYHTQRFFFKLKQFIGPGWLVSMAYLDPGNLEGDIQVGGIRITQYSGYALLWLLFILHIAGWAVQLMAIRIANVTGKDLGTIIRHEHNKFNTYLIWIIIEIAIITADFQAVIGSAISLNVLFGIPVWVGVLVTLLDCLTFLIITVFGIRKLEGVFCVLIIVMVVCFWYNFVSIKVPISVIFHGLFVPTIPPKSTYEALGLLGCIIMPHNLFLHSSLVCSRAVKRQRITRVKEANFYFAIETAIALIISFLINVAVVSSFGGVDVGMLDEELSLYNAHKALEGSLGRYSVYIWGVGLFAAGQNSTMAGTFTGQYVMEGMLDIRMSVFVRMIITRCTTLIPMLVLIFITTHTLDNISHAVNILQAFLLPIALLPLAKISFSSKALGIFSLHIYYKIIVFIICVVVILSNFTVTIDSLIHLQLGVRTRLFIYIAIAFYATWLAYIVCKPVSHKHSLYTH